jgi:hypothetical protein
MLLVTSHLLHSYYYLNPSLAVKRILVQNRHCSNSAIDIWTAISSSFFLRKGIQYGMYSFICIILNQSCIPSSIPQPTSHQANCEITPSHCCRNLRLLNWAQYIGSEIMGHSHCCRKIRNLNWAQSNRKSVVVYIVMTCISLSPAWSGTPAKLSTIVIRMPIEVSPRLIPRWTQSFRSRLKRYRYVPGMPLR